MNTYPNDYKKHNYKNAKQHSIFYIDYIKKCFFSSKSAY